MICKLLILRLEKSIPDRLLICPIFLLNLCRFENGADQAVPFLPKLKEEAGRANRPWQLP
jgi:hypothetical protein